MNRVSLYNKYRPSCFAEIVSQDAIVRVLTNAIRQNRVANAYLFRGFKGSGKTSTARILCKAVNCSEFVSLGDMCGECVGCTKALQDVVEIDAASNRGIDDIDELITTLQYHPKFVDTKFAIIDEAHQLTSTALNALLKIVEEPPSHIKFIFCTTKELAPASSVQRYGTATDKAFMTLSSRCQIFKFNKIANDGILAKLRSISKKENVPISEEVLLSIVGRSDGSLRDAENLLDSVFSFGSDDAVQLLCGDLSVLSAQLLRECCLSSIGDALSSVIQVWDAGALPTEVATDVLMFISDIFQLRAGLTVYRPSVIVDIVREISENVEQNRVESIAVAFSELKKSRLDSILSLELAVCSAMSLSPVDDNPIVDFKEGLPDATKW